MATTTTGYRVIAIESDGTQTVHPHVLGLGAAQGELNVLSNVPGIVRIEIRAGSATGAVIVGWTRACPCCGGNCDCDETHSHSDGAPDMCRVRR